MKIIGKLGQQIRTWEEWERPASPTKHWVPGRSAMEIARAFFRTGVPQLPAAVTSILESHARFAGFVAHTARPEHKTDLPPHGSSGPRNHDVWIAGTVGQTPACVGIEAKADESFDEPLSAKERYGNDRLAAGLDTDMPERLATLGPMLFGASFSMSDPRYARIGYQLIAGLAGTAIQAADDGAEIAAFIVCEFRSERTEVAKQEKNARDLEAFVGLLPGGHTLRPGALVGPFHFPASTFLVHPVDVFIGKVTVVVDQIAG